MCVRHPASSSHGTAQLQCLMIAHNRAAPHSWADARQRICGGATASAAEAAGRLLSLMLGPA